MTSQRRSLPAPRRAVVLVNLGTPDAPTTEAIREYYREFLGDPRVVDVNPVLRTALVNLVIVPFRAPKIAPLYQAVWTEHGSPLLVHGEGLRRAVQALTPDAVVLLAMRYGNPGLAEALQHVDELRIRDVTIVPLFPHEASATTGSVREAVMDFYRGHPRIPSFRFVAPFFDDEAYLSAMSAQLRASLPSDVEHVLFSYHGLPERQVRREDGTGHCLSGGCCDALGPKNAHCYRAQCFATTRLLAQRLGLTSVSTAFQSRFGRDPWIRPYTDEALDALAERGVRRLAIVAPSFVADCLETLEELGVQLKQRFEARGGALTLVPCLNADPGFAAALAKLVRQPIGEVQGA